MVTEKNALIIGYGSIGKLHDSILREMGLNTRIVSQHAESSDRIFRDISAAVSPELNYTVIASKTAMHEKHLETLLDCGFSGKVLVEKPIFANTTATGSFPADRIFVGYNLRYHLGVIAVREALKNRTALSVQHYVGQHLSQWRANTNHLESYSAHKDQGGGVLRDLSHELDLMHYLFGAAGTMKSIGGKFGNVTVDAEDSFGMVMNAERCPLIGLQMNYLDWHGGRRLKIVCDDTSIDMDFTSGDLRIGDTLQTFKLDRETSYRSMHADVLSDHPASACTFAEGMDIIRQIENLEKQ